MFRGHKKRAKSAIAMNNFPKMNNFPDPTPEMLETLEFKAIWQCIKSWDINVPEKYSGYMGANGNHVRAIIDALQSARCLKSDRA